MQFINLTGKANNATINLNYKLFSAGKTHVYFVPSVYSARPTSTWTWKGDDDFVQFYSVAKLLSKMHAWVCERGQLAKRKEEDEEEDEERRRNLPRWTD
jgi:hypothetical protein